MWLLLAGCTGPQATPDGRPPPPHSSVATTHSASEPDGVLRFDGPPPRNLVVLSLDTARKDRFSPWDREARDLTPFLAARMAEGVVLDDVTHCSNWTVASSACLFWGADLLERAPSVGMVPILGGDNRLLQEVPDAPGLAHSLSDAGFETMLVTANSWFGLQHGSVRGFERYFAAPGRPASGVWQAAVTGIEQDALDGPFYLHLHFFEPHEPYLPPASYLPAGLPDPGVPLDTALAQNLAQQQFAGMPPAQQDAVVANMRARYDAEMRWFDDQLSEIWADLDARGLLDDALVMFVTDHGEAQFEKGYFGHAYFLPPAENDAVAFFWARTLQPGAVSTPQVATDLAPTLLDLLGVPIPPSMTGQVLGRDAPRDHRTSFTDAFAGPVNAVRQGDHLMQFLWLGASAVHVCDVAADPECLVERYDPAAPTARDRELWRLLEPQIRATEPWVAGDVRVADGPPWPSELSSR
jgi:arylsulfatase